MDLNELVQAAIAKALADYIETRATVDDAFLDKLADRIAVKVEQKKFDREMAEQRRKQEEMLRQMARIQAQFGHAAAKPAPWPVTKKEFPDGL